MAGIVHCYHCFGGRGYRQRVYVERAQPLEQYTTEELYARFRFGNADIKYIADLVRPKLQRRTRKSHSLSVEQQVLIGLIGDVVKAVSIALASLVNQFVSFPNDVQIAQTKHKFFTLGNMPNTIGFIDCTHVHIQAPHERDWEYINRKGRRSINIQLVGDADLIITNCVVKWPGSVHDARILRESALYRQLQTNRPHGIILGDSAYPLLPWLITPFLAASTPAQARFNTAHCKTRCAIERFNGVLKRRFACLNYLRSGTTGSMQHNTSIYHKPLAFCQNEGLSGRIVRDAIVRNYFLKCSSLMIVSLKLIYGDELNILFLFVIEICFGDFFIVHCFYFTE
uniref:DDE Tnp4 domain-containing protein n=1 Tax=Oryzias latipes TaxID=8090 RepID=A0A3P9JJI7_ORYLA